MKTHTLAVQWHIDNPDMRITQITAEAEDQLPQFADDNDVVIIGQPRFEIDGETLYARVDVHAIEALKVGGQQHSRSIGAENAERIRALHRARPHDTHSQLAMQLGLSRRTVERHLSPKAAA